MYTYDQWLSMIAAAPQEQHLKIAFADWLEENYHADAEIWAWIAKGNKYPVSRLESFYFFTIVWPYNYPESNHHIPGEKYFWYNQKINGYTIHFFGKTVKECYEYLVTMFREVGLPD